MKSARPRSVAVCIDTRDGAGRNRLHGVAAVFPRLRLPHDARARGGKAAAEEVTRLAPDGIISYITDAWLLDAARQLAVPLVDTALTEEPVEMTISPDNATIGRLAADHLTRAGLKNFAYCGVDGRLASEERREEFARSLGLSALAAFSEPVSEGESRIKPLTAWMNKLPKPVGLLVFDDKLGERVITACRWADLSVPQEVAVLGIGNDELMCEVCWPGLSSINLTTSRLGYEAAKLLTQAMDGKKIKDPHRKIQPTGVVARASTDMIASDDELVKSAVRFIAAQSGNPIGVEQVAQSLGVSRRTLDRRFSDTLGRTVSEELWRARMQTARTLLADPSRPILEVASACGYGAASSFSRAFRQETGRWPSEYREEMRSV